MVLLHDLVPHFHLDSHAEHELATVVSDRHHSHSHSHDNHEHDSEENEDIDFFHSLGHLLGDSFHTDEAQDHLTHIPTDYKVFLSKLKVYYVVLVSLFLLENETLEKEKVPSFSPLPYKRCLFTATPLRAPPVLV
jgi:hypothetical protein